MADKLTQQIIESLTRGAAEPSGLPLYSSKADAGLFPNTTSAKPAAQKCLTDDLIRITGSDAKLKTPRDLYGLTEKGWEYLLAAVNPKQVLEDFVRVLETRQGEVGELLDTARRMADSLQGLKEAVARVLPVVAVEKVVRPQDPTPQPPPPRGEGEGAFDETQTPRGGRRSGSPSPLGGGGWGVGSAEPVLALLEASPATDLAPAILAHLAEHRGPTDCPLPDLFRAIARNTALTIGEFHDCLRTLYADGALSLHSWTAPLYTMPEPQFALLVGHDVAYYASLKSRQWTVSGGQ